MTEAAAREQIRDVAAALEAIRLRILGVHASLPAPARGDGEELEEEVTLRTVIECILNDSLEPAIRDLRTAARG